MKKYLTFDNILSVIVGIAAIWTDISIFNLGLLPMTWRIAGISILTILALLCIAFTLKKLPNWGIWTRRSISVLLVIAMSVTCFYISKADTFTKNITEVKDPSAMISVVVHKDSRIDSLEELSDKTVGMNTLTDKTNAEYAKDNIAKEVENVEYVEKDNYIDLAKMLLDKKIDALIISDSYIDNAAIEEKASGFASKIKTLKSWERVSTNNNATSDKSEKNIITEPFTVLISGMDDRGTPNHNSRSDVNMLVMINPQTRLIQMASIPRDAYVPNPAIYNGNDKLTHLGNHGMENLVSGIEYLIGFDIDFYTKVNFTSVLAFVDALGGVEVDVPYTFTEQNSKRQKGTIHIEKGLQILDGEQALAFARHRYSVGVGDVGRTKAQQTVLKAIIKKALSTPNKIPELLNIAPKYMVTNFTTKQLETFLSYQLENMGSWKMMSLTLENGNYAGLSTASMGAIPLSCFLMGRGDMNLLSQKYEMIYNPMTLDAFKFNLSNMDKYIPTASIKPGSEIVFSDMDYSKYLGKKKTNSSSTDKSKDKNKTPTKEESTPQKDTTKKEETIEDTPVETPPADTPPADTPTDSTEDNTTDTPDTPQETPTDTPSVPDQNVPDGNNLPTDAE